MPPIASRASRIAYVRSGQRPCRWQRRRCRTPGTDDQHVDVYRRPSYACVSLYSMTGRGRRYDRPPVDYPVETFTAAERARLAPHFTNLDRPGVRAGEPARDGQGRAVRALLALPGHAAPAVPRRVRRRPAGRRRRAGDGGEGERAAQLYERIFVGYGDDSVAQLGGAHVACEWVSNVLTKVLQRPRLGAYLEQSTRYIAYDAPMPAPPAATATTATPSSGREYDARDGRALRDLLGALPRVGAWAEREFPARRRTSRRPRYARAIKAKALDLLRGLLPASSLSHMGIFATGQTYEQLILHLLAHPLPEARATAR